MPNARTDAPLRPAMLALSVALALGGGAFLSPLYAQSPKAEPVSVSVPAGSLSEALNSLARQAGLTLSVDPALVSGLTAPAVSGELGAEDALSRLLADSGLTYRILGDGVVSIVRAPVDQGPMQLSAITVQGELLERRLQDTQTSVSVELGEKLDRSTDKDLFDVIDRLPNVNAQGGGFGFVIRGITPSGPARSGTAQAINVQVDGAVVPFGQATQTGPTSTWDLEQIEVLRGPQSTQQGPSAIAGAIILRSKDPVFEEEYKLRADYGSFDEQRLAIAANAPLSDSFAVRFAAETYESDGDIEHFQTGKPTADEYLRTLRAKLRYQPDDRLDIVLGHSYTENRLGVQGVIDTDFPDERVQRQQTDDKGRTNLTNLRIAYAFNDQWTLESETSRFDNDYRLDNPLEPGNPFNTPAFRTVDFETKSQEFKLLHEGDDLRAVIGLYYLETDRTEDFAATIPDATPFGFPGASAVLGTDADLEITNYAVFGEVEYDLTAKLTGIAGLRYDTEEQDNLNGRSIAVTPEPFPGFNSPGTPVATDNSYSALLPKAGVVYAWTDNLRTGFTYQRGYRAGGVGSFAGGIDDYDPEFADNYELSLRSESADGRLTANANLFYTEYEDLQVFVFGPSGTFADGFIDNASSASLWGGELQLNFDVNNHLNLFANIGYTKTKFGSFITNSGGPVDVSGNEFAEAPRWTGSIGGSYFFGNGWEASADVNYTDSSYYNVTNFRAEENKPFTLVNAKVGYQSDDFWSIYLYARNLFDEQYLSRKRVDGSSTAGDSRVIGLNFNAEF